MDETINIPLFAGENENIAFLEKELGIEKNIAHTLLFDALPMLKRKYDLLQYKSGSHELDENSNMRLILNEEVPNVFQNYALANLQNNKNILIYLIKQISEQMSDSAARKIIEKHFEQDEDTLTNQLAGEMGISKSHIKDFRTKVIPRIKKFTISMYKKKLRKQNHIDKADSFMQFVIDNIFIDEFENHPFVRSVTDESNRAILPPKAKNIAIRLISVWLK